MLNFLVFVQQNYFFRIVLLTNKREIYQSEREREREREGEHFNHILND